jgi:hypothetical protein
MSRAPSVARFDRTARFKVGIALALIAVSDGLGLVASVVLGVGADPLRWRRLAEAGRAGVWASCQPIPIPPGDSLLCHRVPDPNRVVIQFTPPPGRTPVTWGSTTHDAYPPVFAVSRMWIAYRVIDVSPVPRKSGRQLSVWPRWLWLPRAFFAYPYTFPLLIVPARRRRRE